MKRILLTSECGKVLKDRRFLLLWVGALFVYCFLMWREYRPWNEYISTPGQYEAMYATFEGQKPEIVLTGLEQWIDKTKAQMDGGDLDVPEWTNGWEEILPSVLLYRKMLLEEIYQECLQVVNRPGIMARIEERTDQILNSPLYQGIMSEKEKSLLRKTAHDYRIASVALETTILSPQKGVKELLQDHVSEIWILILLFAVSYLMVDSGHQNGMEKVVISTSQGISKIIFFRFAAFLILIGLIWTSFFLSRWAVLLSWYSTGSLERPIQSVSTYSSCLYSISVREMILICFLGKWLCLWVLSVMQMALMELFHSFLAADVLTAAFYGISCWLYQSISDSSTYVFLKYGNVFYAMCPDVVFGNYDNRWILGTWIISWQYALLWMAVFGIVFAFGAFLFRNAKFQGLPAIKTHKRSCIHGLFFMENRKGIVLARGWLVISAVILFQGSYYYGREIRLGQEEGIYRYYMDKWSCVLTGKNEELEEQIETEELALNRVLSGESGMCSEELAVMRLQQLSIVKERYDKLRCVAETKGKGLLFFYEGEYDLLVNYREHDVRNGAIASLMMILLIISVTGLEYESGMRKLIRSFGFGERAYYVNKVKYIGEVVFVVMLLSYLPDFILTVKAYPLTGLAFPAASLPSLVAFPVTVSIGEYLILLYAIRGIGLFFIGLLAFAVTEKVRKPVFALIICFIVIWIPYAFYYLRINRNSLTGIAFLLAGNDWLKMIP